MSENENHNSPAAIPNGAENFRTVPKDSATFGNVPKASESFRSVPHVSERKENHSLTVRDAARLFETAGVARTERSITNWCQPNRTGMARLDAYFDPNERKYFITPQSVELAIAEEKAKAAKVNQPAEPFGTATQDFRTIPKAAERTESPFLNDSENREVRELENQVRDLQITNKAKDIVIEQMQKERTGFFEQVISASRKVGELETKLLQLDDLNEKPGH